MPGRGSRWIGGISPYVRIVAKRNTPLRVRFKLSEPITGGVIDSVELPRRIWADGRVVPSITRLPVMA
jgi:hypothetical protein